MNQNIAEATHRDPDLLLKKPWGEWLSIAEIGLEIIKEKRKFNKKQRVK